VPSFTCLSNSSISVLLLKRNFTLLSKALGKERLPMVSKTGSPLKQTPISRALLGISFGFSSKGALPPGSPHRAPTERDDPFPEPSFIHLSKSPLYQPPSRFPSRVLMERDARLQSLPLHIFPGSPVKKPASRFPKGAPIERDAPFPKLSFNYLSKFPVHGPPPTFPNRAPTETPVSRAFFYAFPDNALFLPSPR
jgi:hypothetical protein